MMDEHQIRRALWERFMVQLNGWDTNPPKECENYGSIALSNAIWQIFPEYQAEMTLSRVVPSPPLREE